MILSACLNCWNDFDVFRAREFFFTSLGMFGFNDEDRSTVEKRWNASSGSSGIFWGIGSGIEAL